MFCEHLPWTILKYWKANLTEHPGETRENVIILVFRFHPNTHYQLECLAFIKLFGMTFMPWISVYITNSKEVVMVVILFFYNELLSVNCWSVMEHTKLQYVLITITIRLWNIILYDSILLLLKKRKKRKKICAGTTCTKRNDGK